MLCISNMHETYIVQQGISQDFLSNLALVNHRGNDSFFCLQSLKHIGGGGGEDSHPEMVFY